MRKPFAIVVALVQRFLLYLISTFVSFPLAVSALFTEIVEFVRFFSDYVHKKAFLFMDLFEGGKNQMVKGILIRRGRGSRMFLHTAAMSLLMFAALISPFISSALLESDDNLQANAFDGTYVIAEDVFETTASKKPRDEIISYTVQKGDTVSTIAERFGVSEDTVRWANDISGDNIRVGDDIHILPVTGVAHKVKAGDTVYTIADKYDANPQGIVDFPFNDFANPQTFSLVVGQYVIVPDGVPPQVPAAAPARRQYLATGPVAIGASGFSWPVRGTLNQYFAWYHPGVDIGAGVGTPVVAATSGTVSGVYTGGWNGGYGVHVIISGDNGYTTLYAHLSGVNVSSGQRVAAGSTTVGWVGMTGRTTGPHLHFEVRGGAGSVNPLGVLQ